MKEAAPATEEEKVIRGVIRRVTFYNRENGYTVLQLSVPDEREQVTVVGTHLDPKVGAHLVARGAYKEHPKFGLQFQANAITATTPTSVDGLETYLGSGLIKGIGPKTAQRIIAEFGDDALTVIHRDPERLAKIPGIGKHKATMVSQAFAEQSDIRAVTQFLVEHDISTGLAARIYERYKNRAVEILSRDPYLLARDMRGVGFATADTIALKLGLAPHAPQRLKAGLFYTLEKASEEGHCYLTRHQLQERARVLLGLGDEHDLEAPFQELLAEDYVVTIEDKIFLKHLNRAEDFVAEFVAARCTETEAPVVTPEDTARYLTIAATEIGLTFSHEQIHAVELATRHKFMIITGGPGCGKTTVTKALVSVFRHAGKILALAAPTGRAAQRMAQVCGIPASTIHRLLRYDPSTGGFLHGINDPLIADVVIVDEASMIDVVLAKDLFSAIPRNATVILVGDKDQLPSVGPGRVFGDLVAIREVTTVALSKLFRRAEESTINSIAVMINSGATPEIPEPDGVTKADGYFIARKDPAEAAATIEKLVADQIPRKFGIAAADITVLTPSNRGPLGTIALNQLLQHRLNPSGSIDAEQEIHHNGIDYRIGDRVCQRVNNYQLDTLGVFNGDTGTIYAVNKSERNLVVELWDGRLVRYESRDIGQLSHAYAITVHRSQGSEIPCVVLAIHDSHFTLLERQLLYTAVTRAKKLLIIVGSKRALALATQRMNSKRRQTFIPDRVAAALR